LESIVTTLSPPTGAHQRVGLRLNRGFPVRFPSPAEAWAHWSQWVVELAVHQQLRPDTGIDDVAAVLKKLAIDVLRNGRAGLETSMVAFTGLDCA